MCVCVCVLANNNNKNNKNNNYDAGHSIECKVTPATRSPLVD